MSLGGDLRFGCFGCGAGGIGVVAVVVVIVVEGLAVAVAHAGAVDVAVTAIVSLPVFT